MKKYAGGKKFRHHLELWGVKIVGGMVRVLPYRAVLGLADFLGRLAFDVLRIRRKVSLSNLRLAFRDEKSRNDLTKIARRSYQIIARSFLEHLYLPRLDQSQISHIVQFDSLAPFQKALQGKRGAVLVSAHFGSWQLFGVAAALSGFPMNFLVQQQGNAMVDELVYQYIRDKGLGVLHRKFAVRETMDLLAGNEFVAMLADQDAGRNGVIVNFFGHPVSAPRGPAYFALKTGAPIITGFIVNQHGSGLKGYFQEPFYAVSSGNEAQDIKKIMQEITSRIERFVREYPDHWFWPHRRWKSTLGKHELR